MIMIHDSVINPSLALFLSVQMNPQHVIPTINDDGFCLWESRAILGYLANKYDKTGLWYPTDAVARAHVDQKLYFDMGTLYQRYAEYYYPQMFAQQPADPEKYKKIEEAFAFLDTALEGKKYATGNNPTIADYALVASVSTFDVSGFAVDKYPNVQRWYETAQALPGYELNKAGCEAFKHLLANIKK